MEGNTGIFLFNKDFVKGETSCDIEDRKFLTDNLIESIHKSAARYCLNNNDDDKYCLSNKSEGYNFFTCSDGIDYDPEVVYYYHTIHESENEAIISVTMRWLHPLYKRRMVKESGKWKLDAVDCGRGWNKLPFGME